MAVQQNTMAAKCSCCGGPLRFDPNKQKLVCDFCLSEFTQEEVEKSMEEQAQRAVENQSGTDFDDGVTDWGKDGKDMKAMSCSSCGAEMIAEENTAALRCPYCGNNTIVPAEFDGAVKPNYVIPFAFTKKQAEEKYKNYYSGKKLLPKAFLSENKIEEIQGVYVPFWLFDGTAEVDGKYAASDRTETQTQVIKKLYNVQRKGTINFKNVPADASQRMPDDLMDSIEPYKFDELKPFSMTYLPGFLAERFNVSDEENKVRAEKRIKQTASDRTRDTIKHNSIDSANENIKVDYSEQKYALLPVWYLTTKWNGEQYSFAMNGQTGAFIGDLPIDKGKFALITIIAFLLPAILCFLLASDILMSVILGAVIALITALVCHGSMKPVSKAHNANEYMDKSVKLSVQTEQFLRTVTTNKPKQQPPAQNK